MDPRGWAGRVGSRVVVRHRLPDGGLTDSVGELLEALPDRLRLLTRGGETVVALSDVVLSRVVPPRPRRAAPPHRAAGVGDLQRVMNAHWKAADQEGLGDWVLRAHQGFTDRADSVLTAPGRPGLPLHDGPGGALAAVRAWYGARGLPPQLALARLVGPDVTDAAVSREGEALEAVAQEVGRAGWVMRPGAGALVLTAPTVAVARAAAGLVLPPGLVLRLDADLDEHWLDVYHYLGRTVPPVGQDLLRDGPEVVFASVRDASGQALAVARGSLAHAWGAVSAVETRDGHRRRGLARVLLGALGGWFTRHRAAAVVLQTAIDNTVSQELYRGLGFETHHRSDYWGPGG